ncbi:MAG: hypothetical protein RL470_1140, partial [Actinomycetota bacterium]
LQNGHRWFFFAGLIFNTILTIDAVLAFRNPEKEWGHMSVGTLVLLLNATLLWLYSLSCHTCRHTIGGRLRNFSKHPVRYKFWKASSAIQVLDLGIGAQSQAPSICVDLSLRSSARRSLCPPRCQWHDYQRLFLLGDRDDYFNKRKRCGTL